MNSLITLRTCGAGREEARGAGRGAGREHGSEVNSGASLAVQSGQHFLQSQHAVPRTQLGSTTAAQPSPAPPRKQARTSFRSPLVKIRPTLPTCRAADARDTVNNQRLALHTINTHSKACCRCWCLVPRAPLLDLNVAAGGTWAMCAVALSAAALSDQPGAAAHKLHPAAAALLRADPCHVLRLWCRTVCSCTPASRAAAAPQALQLLLPTPTAALHQQSNG